MQATDDRPMPETSRTRGPLEGQALLDFVARLVIKSYSAAAIAKKASIPYPQAVKLKEQLLRAACDSIDLSEEEKVLWKRENAEYLRYVRDASLDAYRASARGGEPNARQLNPGVAAGKILNTMYGFDAPTRTVNTDIRIYAQVQPKDMDRVLADPRARAAMLEFEERVSEINAAEPEPEVVIDVTPDAEGGPA